MALARYAPMTDSDSTIGEDYEDDHRNHKRANLGKDTLNRNLSEKKRRDQFSMLVHELCTLVSTTGKKMDKSTVLKSTISFLMNHQETTDQANVHEISDVWKPSFLNNDEFMHLMLEALDSFLLVFSQEGVILYASESVTLLLGHLPSDLVNKSMYDFVSKDESVNLHNLLYNYTVAMENGVPECKREENQLSFDCNFRRGQVSPNGPFTYEPVIIQGSFKYLDNSADDEELLGDTIKDQMCFCSTVRLQTCHLVREMFIVNDNNEFTSRHSLEWKFLFLDQRAPPIIGYIPFELLGMSGYDYYHPDDLDGITQSHEQLMKTGEGTSCYYRFLTKGQQWIWLKTQYFITYHQWNSKPAFISCTNAVVSYEDVRSHKWKELGIVDDEGQLLLDTEGSPSCKMTSSPSVGIVTSAGRLDSAWSSSPPHQSSADCKTVCADESGINSSMYPTSTSHIRSRAIADKLQLFLQRHQQKLCQPSMSPYQHKIPPPRSPTATCTSSSSPSTLPLRQLLYRRQQQQQLQQQQQQQQPGQEMTQYQRILPRASNLSGLEPLLSMLPANVYMTPVQQQLHEQLQQKARQVQEAIMRHQNELSRITQQLIFAQVNVPINPITDNMNGEPDYSNVVSTSQEGIQQQQDPTNVARNEMVNQPSVLQYPVLAQDAEMYNSLSDTIESAACANQNESHP